MAKKEGKLLIVDDNPANLGMLTSYLKEYGYKTPTWFRYDPVYSTSAGNFSMRLV